MKNSKGQFLVGAILLLVVLAVLVPVMVLYVQNESRWSTKQGQNANAFQLAEAALDRGYQKVTESTNTWAGIQSGSAMTGYNFDTSYTDLPGGSYAISVTSGPGSQVATIIGIGRDARKKEVRALQTVYANTPLGSNAIRSQSGVTISGTNVEVEWGSVAANSSIATLGRNHPLFYSAAGITPQDANGSAPPNTDSRQWWSYMSNMPPSPYIDFAFYKSSAQASGTYYATTQNWAPPCGDAASCNTGKTYYVDGDLNVASPGIFVGGNLFVMGNLNLPNGRSGQGAPTIPLPPLAWKQYANDWAYYTAGGPACSISWNDTTPGRPATFPGANSSYKSDSTITVPFSTSKVIVNGFLYVAGNMTQGGGGGQTVVVGSAYVLGNVTIGSNNVCVFRSDAASNNIVTTNLLLTRQSWQDVVRDWPPALP